MGFVDDLLGCVPTYLGTLLWHGPGPWLAGGRPRPELDVYYHNAPSSTGLMLADLVQSTVATVSSAPQTRSSGPFWNGPGHILCMLVPSFPSHPCTTVRPKSIIKVVRSTRGWRTNLTPSRTRSFLQHWLLWKGLLANTLPT